MAKPKPVTLRNRIKELRYVETNGLESHPGNWRDHPREQAEALSGVLREVGIADALIAYESPRNAGKLTLIDGHLRKDSAPGKWPVLVLDVDDAEADYLLATLDPLTGMATAAKEALDALLTTVTSGEAAVQQMLSEQAARAGLYLDGAEQPGGDPGAQLNRAEELREQYGVERGQLWEIGRHRLLCGDAYSDEDRKRLLGDLTADMLHIDPPYGISIVQPKNGALTAADGGSKPFTGGTSGTDRKSGAAFRSARTNVGRTNPANIVQSNLYPVIQGDDRPFDPTVFLGIAPIVIMWGANYYAGRLPTSPCWVVWDKREDIIRNTFADCEIAWTNLDKPARLFHHLWNGLHKGSQHGERRTHPTEKPVALFEEVGKMFCPGGVWLDLFCGTGAQIVAAEHIPGVRCCACEIEPLYVATTIQRLADMGLTPKLVSDERP